MDDMQFAEKWLHVSALRQVCPLLCSAFVYDGLVVQGLVQEGDGRVKNNSFERRDKTCCAAPM